MEIWHVSTMSKDLSILRSIPIAEPSNCNLTSPMPTATWPTLSKRKGKCQRLRNATTLLCGFAHPTLILSIIWLISRENKDILRRLLDFILRLWKYSQNSQLLTAILLLCFNNKANLMKHSCTTKKPSEFSQPLLTHTLIWVSLCSTTRLLHSHF